MAGTGKGIILPPAGPERTAAIEALITKREAPKECKGKVAARCLARLVLDPRVETLYLDKEWLAEARKALEPFGYPDITALKEKLGL